MKARTAILYVAVAVPSLALAAVGVTHPMHLTDASAEYWRNLHIGTLVVFPLLGFAPWLVVRGHNLVLSWVVGVLAFLYGALYTALDVLAGIGAGGLKLDHFGSATSTVFGLGNAIGTLGNFAFIAAVVIAAASALLWARSAAVPGALLVIVGSLLFYDNHIYFPVGVIGQLCLAVGWVAILLALRRPLRQVSDTSAPPATAGSVRA
ncbi:hypothetical protein [Glaciihabitans sp. UYNi722]|uniref:hypothetical protein n=1 Tax=Glaciihabitans sp. UYNi722 TaxID=3156344 RepID=UPI003398B4E1